MWQNPTQHPNNWLWHDLFVAAEGQLSRKSYFVALFRIAIIYVVGVQLFAIFQPSLLAMVGKSSSENPLDRLVVAQIGAQFLIAWPAWSIFQRRLNDIRPNIRSKLSNWAVGFPLYMAILLIVMVVSAFGIELPIDKGLHGTLRLCFFLMLFCVGLFPGIDSETVTPSVAQSGRDIQEQVPTELKELFAARRQLQELFAKQIVPEPTPAIQPIRNAAPASSFPDVMERGRKMPEQGRVKPGWFS